MPLLREKDSDLLILYQKTLVIAVTANLTYMGDPIDLKLTAAVSFGIELDKAVAVLDEGKLTYWFQFAEDDGDAPSTTWFDGSSDAIMPRYKRPPNNTLETTAASSDGMGNIKFQQPIGVAGDAPARWMRPIIRTGPVALSQVYTATLTPIIRPLITPSQLWKVSGHFPNDGRP